MAIPRKNQRKPLKAIIPTTPANLPINGLYAKVAAAWEPRYGEEISPAWELLYQLLSDNDLPFLPGVLF
jgi:hypothetical protein